MENLFLCAGFALLQLALFPGSPGTCSKDSPDLRTQSYNVNIFDKYKKLPKIGLT